MNSTIVCRIAALLLSLSGVEALAYGVSHHGGIIMDCEAPIFFDESPGKDARVRSFQAFSLVASENTDAGTIKVWVNNQPMAVKVTTQRSGRISIEGSLKAPITQGKAWIKATAYSLDGCDQLHNWNVFVGP